MPGLNFCNASSSRTLLGGTELKFPLMFDGRGVTLLEIALPFEAPELLTLSLLEVCLIWCLVEATLAISFSSTPELLLVSVALLLCSGRYDSVFICSSSQPRLI